MLLIIILPLGWAIFWKFTTFNAPPLPIYYPEDVNEKGDTIYHTVSNYKMADQNGDTFSLSQLDTCIYVANFFFATCKTICPKMNEQVKRLQDAFAGQKGFQILTFTVDPDKDSVAALKVYAEMMKADPSQWWFLTGQKDSIYDLARNGFLVPAAIGAAGDFFHSQDLILIDKEKRMRGLYDGTEPAAVDTMIDEIKVLMKEYQ